MAVAVVRVPPIDLLACARLAEQEDNAFAMLGLAMYFYQMANTQYTDKSTPLSSLDSALFTTIEGYCWAYLASRCGSSDMVQTNVYLCLMDLYFREKDFDGAKLVFHMMNDAINSTS